MTRSTKTARAAVQFPVVLKSLHNDIVTATPTSTATPKSMRVVLRQKLAAVHARNSSWVFNNQSEYDAARALFDPAYAARIAKPAKQPRARKTAAAKTPAE